MTAPPKRSRPTEGSSQAPSTRDTAARSAPEPPEGARQTSPPAEANGETPRPVRGDKRERILHAAVSTFAQHGFFSTRVSDVAKAAGVADGTIYLYFASKEELLLSLFQDRLTKLLAYMRKELAPLPTPKARLRAIIEIQLGLLENQRELAEVITVTLRQSSRIVKENATPLFSAYLDAIASVIQEGQKDGSFRSDVSPFTTARALYGALDGIALTWVLGKADRGGLKRAAANIVAIFLQGLEPVAESESALVP
jgi:TetR/AcrR family fatty acid metabolism transcriptional regulator